MKNTMIKAICNVLSASGGVEIAAWDFPARPYKKAVEAILKTLEMHDIQGERTIAEWPHFTLAYIQGLTHESKEKIKLAAPSCLSRISTDKLIALKGEKFPKTYIAWSLKFDDMAGVKKLIEYIEEETGSKQKFEFKPHVSLVMVDSKYQERIVEILPEIYQAAKPHKISYTPSQLQFWSDMQISDIEKADFF